MNEIKKDRDILDLSTGEVAKEDAIPGENKPVENPDRPQVTPEDRQAFLSEFLSESDKENQSADGEATEAPEETGVLSPEQEELKERIIETLKSIYDPEIPVDIYELGLIYDVRVDDNSLVTVTMTLTTPHCPVAEIMPGEVEMKVNAVPGVMGAEVKLVWDPPWDMSRMTDEARLELGLL